MKYLLLLGSSLLLACPAHAQFGLRAGGNLLRLASDSLPSSSRVGYQVGIFYQIPLTAQWSLVPEVQFSRERLQATSLEETPKANYQLRFSYLNLPVVARLTLGQVYIEAGPQLSWLVGGRGEGTIAYSNTFIRQIGQAVTDRYRRFDVGPCLGIGVKLPAGLGLSVRAYQGLGSILRQNSFPSFDTAIPYAGHSSQHRQTLQASLTYQIAKR